MRKQAIRKRLWAIVDRYDTQRLVGVEDLCRTKADAIAAARYDLERGYTCNGRLSVVQVTLDILTETEVTADSYCNDGEGSDAILAGLDKAQAEKARLEAEWNSALLAAEVA